MDTTSKKREELTDALAQASRNFRLLLASFSAEQFNKSPFEGSWTPGQVGEHILLADKNLKRALSTSGMAITREADERVPQLRDTFLNMNVKFTSAAIIDPPAIHYDMTELIEQFNSSRTDLSNLLQTSELSELHTHSLLGEVSKLELLWVVVYHTRRHTLQLENMRNSFVTAHSA